MSGESKRTRRKKRGQNVQGRGKGLEDQEPKEQSVLKVRCLGDIVEGLENKEQKEHRILGQMP
jgi:hypothetical protein